MKKSKIVWLILFVVMILSIVSGIVGYKSYHDKLEKETLLKKQEEEKRLALIEANYSSYVITNEESKLYSRIDNEYKEIGSIAKDVVLKLKEQEITHKTEYFEIIDLDQEYFISYKDVSPSVFDEKNKRYKNYILLDKEIVTKDITNIYFDDTQVYSINKSFSFPVYIIDNDKYYVEYDGELMYILKEDIKEIKEVKHGQSYASEIPVIVYHFFYDPQKEVCNQSICHSKNQFSSHLDYIKNNEFFTPTMNEFELFMDGKIRLPKKSVLITIDDGHMASLGIEMLKDYKLNGTIFLITSAYDKQYYTNEYVEAHSHTHNMHNAGVCPGGQGGGIKCLDRQSIQNDLKASSDALGGSKVLCYPFYEYNDYSISMLKQAGYKMAFAGYYAGGTMKARMYGDKYQIPRVTMGSNSDVSYLASVIN